MLHRGCSPLHPPLRPCFWQQAQCLPGLGFPNNSALSSHPGLCTASVCPREPLWSLVTSPGSVSHRRCSAWSCCRKNPKHLVAKAGPSPSPQVHTPHVSRHGAMGKISMGQAQGKNDVQGRFVRGKEAGNHFRNQNKRLSHFLLSVPSS